MTHNNLNNAVAEAVSALQEAHLPGRDCVIQGETAVVLLHDEECLRVEKETHNITLNGKAMATRKTVRLVNSILSLFTGQRVMTRNGIWYLVNCNNLWTQFSGQSITFTY